MARVKKSRESQESAPLGRVIAVLRAALDWTQSDLARLSGVKRSSISEYERGKSSNPASPVMTAKPEKTTIRPAEPTVSASAPS